MTSQNPFDTSFWIAVVVLSAATLSCFGYAGMQLPDESPTRQHTDVMKSTDTSAPKAHLPGWLGQSPKTRTMLSFSRAGHEHASL